MSYSLAVLGSRGSGKSYCINTLLSKSSMKHPTCSSKVKSYTPSIEFQLTEYYNMNDILFPPDGFMIIYDITYIESFNEAKIILKNVHEKYPDTPISLIANKEESYIPHVIDWKDALKFIEEIYPDYNNIPYGGDFNYREYYFKIQYCDFPHFSILFFERLCTNADLIKKLINTTLENEKQYLTAKKILTDAQISFHNAEQNRKENKKNLTKAFIIHSSFQF